MYENRKYVIIPASEINNVNFSEVLETSAETCRYSVGGLNTFIKYEGSMPPSIGALISKSPEFTHDEILLILSTSEWTSEPEEV